MIRWGLWGGGVLGVLTIALAPLLGPLFTGDAAVHDLLVPVLIVVGLGQPLSGLVFVLDGVLIGAGDGTLSRQGRRRDARRLHPGRAARRRARRRAGEIWVVFTVVLMGSRAVLLVRRERGDAWLVTGIRAAA